QQSGVALAHLVTDCNLVVAREFLALGAPLRAPSRWRPEGDFMPVVVLAAHCGDLAFVEELVSRGALRRQRDADAFLTAAVNSGFPALVELALRYSRNLTQGENGGLLNDAVMVYVSEDHPNHARFS